MTIVGILALALTAAIRPCLTWAGPPLLFPQKTASVAVDPGHGGRDSGARGPTGTLEKSVCLELARNLAVRLESRYQVVLTRSDDYHVELQQRAAIANQADADLLVSLHTGAGYIHSIRGISIYYHVPLRVPDGTGPPAGSKADPQLWENAQSRHQPESLSLATTLKQYLDQMPEAPPCRIRGVPLPLLQGADMPAVLIEIGHITHPATETKLALPQQQELISEQIANAIEEFISRRRGT